MTAMQSSAAMVSRGPDTTAWGDIETELSLSPVRDRHATDHALGPARPCGLGSLRARLYRWPQSAPSGPQRLAADESHNDPMEGPTFELLCHFISGDGEELH